MLNLCLSSLFVHFFTCCYDNDQALICNVVLLFSYVAFFCVTVIICSNLFNCRSFNLVVAIMLYVILSLLFINDLILRVNLNNFGRLLPQNIPAAIF